MKLSEVKGRDTVKPKLKTVIKTFNVTKIEYEKRIDKTNT